MFFLTGIVRGNPKQQVMQGKCVRKHFMFFEKTILALAVFLAKREMFIKLNYTDKFLMLITLISSN